MYSQIFEGKYRFGWLCNDLGKYLQIPSEDQGTIYYFAGSGLPSVENSIKIINYFEPFTHMIFIVD